MASNTITLSSVSGTPQTEVEVVVSLNNTDAITALEMNIPLGEHLSYVNSSATLATTRSNGHQLSAAQVGQDLRIYIYSLSLNALQGNMGELLTFRLLLGNEPANYTLSPTVVLSNAQGTSIDGSVQAGSVAIQAPKLQIVNSQIDYGHVPIRATYTKNLQLKNVGNLPLTIEKITTTDPLFVPKQTTLTIAAGQTTSVAIDYTPTERGAVSAEAIVKSNAINGEQVATIMADPFSVNELHVGTASGIADSIVTISLTMNNMEPIVAMQCAFVLPEQLVYVANSIQPNAVRTNGHQVLSTLRSDTLFLAIFSMSNQPLHANDGEIATFQLRLNGNSGGYGLYPQDVVLSNITEENMVSATYGGWVNIQSPSLYGTDDLHFGNCPITETAIAAYSFNNYGDAPLQIKRVTFLAEGYSVVTPLPLVVNPGEEGSLQIAYDPKSEGDFSTTMNLYTNDPNNRLKTVSLSGHVFEPNALSLTGESNRDGTYTLSVAMDNYTDIVAVQYDLHWRSDMTTSQSAFVPSARMQNHNAVVTPLDEDSYRVIIYSMSNATIAGHNGELHQLVFTPQGEVNYCGSTISVDNIVLSNAAGGDKTSVKATSLSTAHTKWENITATACDEFMWNGDTFTETGIYIDTIPSQAGCDSIITLHLTINRTITTEETEVACDSYTWTDGKTYTESGTYYQYLKTVHGCDSTVVLHLTVNRSIEVPYEVTACDSYTWSNGITYTQSGVYHDSLKTIHGCDSVEILTLTINYSDTAYFSATACDSYVWHEETYTASGTYEYLTQTIHGCDTLEVLTLTINRSVTSEETYVSCDSYTWNGQTYTTTGAYTYTTNAANGCDSIVTLHLTINATKYTEETVTACDSYTWNGETYTESGEYTYTTTAANGCDSIVTLRLTINNTQYAEEIVTACDSYAWNGKTYNESGEYVYTTTAANGCDSIVTLHLTINKSEREEYTAVACDEYWWHDNQYTESGDYTYNTTTADGCERIEVLHLTILPEATTESEELMLCPSELPYDWYGQWLTEAGTYSATEQYAGMECDSIIHELTLNVYVQTLPAAVTLPIVRTGEAIDVTIPTAEIQAHMAAETWYAPNALVAWYVMNNSNWTALTDEPVATGITEVILKYAVETDCGNIESDKMVIAVETTDVENMQSPSPSSNCQKILYEDHIYILREGKVYSVMGHEM